jgi:thioredoxin-like negative regulator of GroEL
VDLDLAVVVPCLTFSSLSHKPNCLGCKRIAPMVKELAQMASDEKMPFKVAEINCQANPQICDGYSVRTTPQMWIFYKAGPLHRSMGLNDQQGRAVTRFPYDSYPMPKLNQEETLNEDVMADFAKTQIKAHQEYLKSKGKPQKDL